MKREGENHFVWGDITDARLPRCLTNQYPTPSSAFPHPANVGTQELKIMNMCEKEYPRAFNASTNVRESHHSIAFLPLSLDCILPVHMVPKSAGCACSSHTIIF